MIDTHIDIQRLVLPVSGDLASDEQKLGEYEYKELFCPPEEKQDNIAGPLAAQKETPAELLESVEGHRATARNLAVQLGQLAALPDTQKILVRNSSGVNCEVSIANHRLALQKLMIGELESACSKADRLDRKDLIKSLETIDNKLAAEPDGKKKRELINEKNVCQMLLLIPSAVRLQLGEIHLSLGNLETARNLYISAAAIAKEIELSYRDETFQKIHQHFARSFDAPEWRTLLNVRKVEPTTSALSENTKKESSNVQSELKERPSYGIIPGGLLQKIQQPSTDLDKAPKKDDGWIGGSKVPKSAESDKLEIEQPKPSEVDKTGKATEEPSSVPAKDEQISLGKSIEATKSEKKGGTTGGEQGRKEDDAQLKIAKIDGFGPEWDLVWSKEDRLSFFRAIKQIPLSEQRNLMKMLDPEMGRMLEQESLLGVRLDKNYVDSGLRSSCTALLSGQIFDRYVKGLTEVKPGQHVGRALLYSALNQYGNDFASRLLYRKESDIPSTHLGVTGSLYALSAYPKHRIVAPIVGFFAGDKLGELYQSYAPESAHKEYSKLFKPNWVDDIGIGIAATAPVPKRYSAAARAVYFLGASWFGRLYNSAFAPPSYREAHQNLLNTWSEAKERPSAQSMKDCLDQSRKFLELDGGKRNISYLTTKLNMDVVNNNMTDMPNWGFVRKTGSPKINLENATLKLNPIEHRMASVILLLTMAEASLERGSDVTNLSGRKLLEQNSGNNYKSNPAQCQLVFGELKLDVGGEALTNYMLAANALDVLAAEAAVLAKNDIRLNDIAVAEMDFSNLDQLRQEIEKGRSTILGKHDIAAAYEQSLALAQTSPEQLEHLRGQCLNRICSPTVLSMLKDGNSNAKALVAKVMRDLVIIDLSLWGCQPEVGADSQAGASYMRPTFESAANWLKQSKTYDGANVDLPDLEALLLSCKSG